MSRPAKEGESAGYEAWLQGRSYSLSMSVIDLEYEIAMMAADPGDGLNVPAGFADEPETWRTSLSKSFQSRPKWFDRAVTLYLKGR